MDWDPRKAFVTPLHRDAGVADAKLKTNTTRYFSADFCRKCRRENRFFPSGCRLSQMTVDSQQLRIPESYPRGDLRFRRSLPKRFAREKVPDPCTVPEAIRAQISFGWVRGLWRLILRC
jgi:hypothetical protein